MSTRGAIGFRFNGKDYITYNHYDSYPSALGQRVIDNTKAWMTHDPTFSELKAKLPLMRILSAVDNASFEDLQRFKTIHDPNVSVGTDYYSLLRNAQGHLYEYPELGIWLDDTQFIYDSLFCEYAYIVNLDDNVMEVYHGFQDEPFTEGRYTIEKPTDWQPEYPGQEFYFPVKLVQTFALDTLPASL